MKARLTIAFVVALALGFALGRHSRHTEAQRENRVTVLAQDMARLGFAASYISLLEKGQDERLESLLWLGISNSLSSAERQLAAGAVMEYPLFIPNLLDGVERARRLALEAERPDLTARIEALQGHLADM